MRVKQLLGATVTLAVMLGSTAGPALAAPKGGPRGKAVGHWKHEGRFYAQWFSDVAEFEWAARGIARMAALGLMKGEGNRLFAPARSITREEAIVTAVRLMGREEEARDRKVRYQDLERYFSDAEHISSWALPYVYEAVQQDVLPRTEDGQLRPQEAATRLWVSVLLVRAMGLEAEARAAMDTRLSFRDASEIPEAFAGYVVVAVRHGLLLGYPDNTFRPLAAITRAEMALLLTRVDDRLGERAPREGQIRGTIQAVSEDEGTVTVKALHGEMTLKVATDAAIFVDGEAAELSDLEAGMDVVIALSRDAAILYLDARSDTDGQPEEVVTGEVTGVVTEVYSPDPPHLGRIRVRLIGPDGDLTSEYRTYWVAPGARVREDGRQRSLDDLERGDEVRLELHNQVVMRIEILAGEEDRDRDDDRDDDRDEDRHDEDEAPRSGTLEGTVVSLSLAQGSGLATVTVELLSGDRGTGERRTYYIAPDAEIRSAGGSRIALEDVPLGSRVELEVRWGVAVEVKVLGNS